MEMTRTFIAGAGPVGLAAAVELARRGLPVDIVDPDVAVSPQSRALAINARTLDLLAPSGVAGTLLAKGNRVRHIVLRKEAEVLAHIDMANMPHSHKFLLVLPQSQTESVLEAALNAGGRSVRRGVSLESFSQSEDGVALTLSDGTTRTADALLGADGAHSTVRHTLGLPFAEDGRPQHFGLCDVTLDDWPYGFDTAVLTLMPHHVAGFIPMGQGMGRFFTTRPDSLNNLPADAKVRHVLWETDFNIRYRQVQSYQQGRVFLAGDAAHIHSPVGGRGMNLGIEDACWFAFLAAENRLDEYTALRHPVGASVLKLTSALTGTVGGMGSFGMFLFSTLVPLALNTASVQRRALRAMSALDTPAPPWLAASA